MRKQYFFQPSKNGYYAWDVDKLVRQTKSYQIKNILINDIKEVDEYFWDRDSSSKPTCRSIASHIKLVNDADLSFPIILSAEGKVMDGMHRIIKSLTMGLDSIKAVQFEKTPDPDFIDVQPDELSYE